jgi:hypothetical protein
LQAFEKKYGLASADFYELFSQGVLDDGEFEQTRDFCEWAGFYEIKQACLEEAQDQAYQAGLSEWDGCVADGLTDETQKRRPDIREALWQQKLR